MCAQVPPYIRVTYARVDGAKRAFSAPACATHWDPGASGGQGGILDERHWEIWDFEGC